MIKIYSIVAIAVALITWSFGIYRVAYNHAEATYIKQNNEKLIIQNKMQQKSEVQKDSIETSTAHYNSKVDTNIATVIKYVTKVVKTPANCIYNESAMLIINNALVD